MEVDGSGLRLVVPEGWDARITPGDASEAVVLQAATVPLAAKDEVGVETHELMKEGDIYIKVIDAHLDAKDVLDDASWTEASRPPAFSQYDLSARFHNVSLAAYGARFVVMGERALMWYVGFGPYRTIPVTEPPATDAEGKPLLVDELTLNAANEVLAGLAVE